MKEEINKKSTDVEMKKQNQHMTMINSRPTEKGTDKRSAVEAIN